jgi:hypothetical protein
VILKICDFEGLIEICPVAKFPLKFADKQFVTVCMRPLAAGEGSMFWPSFIVGIFLGANIGALVAGRRFPPGRIMLKIIYAKP